MSFSGRLYICHRCGANTLWLQDLRTPCCQKCGEMDMLWPAPPGTRPGVGLEPTLPPMASRQLRASDGEEDCVICAEPMMTGQRAAWLMCAHHYHEECISKWLKSQRSCPLCRQRQPKMRPRPRALQAMSQGANEMQEDATQMAQLTGINESSPSWIRVVAVRTPHAPRRAVTAMSQAPTISGDPHARATTARATTAESSTNSSAHQNSPSMRTPDPPRLPKERASIALEERSYPTGSNSAPTSPVSYGSVFQAWGKHSMLPPILAMPSPGPPRRPRCGVGDLVNLASSAPE